MTTLQTAVDARKLVDELAAFQTSSLQYAQVDQAIWLSENVSRLQELMTYVVDDLINEPSYKSIKEVAKAS